MEKLTLEEIFTIMDSGKYADFKVEFLGYDLQIEEEKEYPVYRLQVVGEEGDKQVVSVSPSELNMGNWHKKIAFLIQIRSARKFNDLVIQLVKQKKRDSVPEKRVYHKLGWKKWEGEWRFLFSNGAITSRGFSKQEISSISGYEFGIELPGKEKMRELQIQFMKLLAKGDIISVVFLHSLMSIIREPLRENGIDMGITLWIYGKPSSGKTEILRYMTNIRGVSRQEIDKKMLAPSEGIKRVMNTLAESSGIPFLLDDVKQEKVQGKRDNARVIIDWVLRSTYRGNLVRTYEKRKTTVDTNAVITGEYMETDRSQSGRLLYMDITGYLSIKAHSDVMRKIQENPELTGYIYGDFILWFANALNDSKSLTSWKNFYKEEQKKDNPYLKLGDGVRVYENYCMLRLVFFIWRQYMSICGLEEPILESGINIVMENSIDKIIGDTAVLLDSIAAFSLLVMNEIIKASRIRKAAYKEVKEGWFHSKVSLWKMEEFCINENDEFLLIEDIEMVWQNVSYVGSVTPRTVLLMTQHQFEQKLEDAVQKVIKDNGMPKGFRGKITLKELADNGLIAFRIEKSGETTRRRYIRDYPGVGMAYPVRRCNEYDEYNGYGECDKKPELFMREIPAIQFNYFHPCFEQLKNASYDTLEEENFDYVNTIKRDEFNSLIRAFVAGKAIPK